MRPAKLASWEGHTAQYWRRVWQAGSVYFFASLDSTNDVAAELGSAGAPGFSVVLAEEQSHGRGRGGASWQAERGTSLLFSVLFRIERIGPAPGSAPIRVGLATAEAIAERVGGNASLKWPNDVVIDGCGKVAGILCEAVLGPQGAGYVVAGIGINVLQGREQFAAELRVHACSLLSATGMRVERSDLLTDVLERLRAFADRIAEPLDDDELARIAVLDVLRDRQVFCDAGAGRAIAGIARGIAPDGALLVEEGTSLTPVYNATVRLAGEHYPGSSRG